MTVDTLPSNAFSVCYEQSEDWAQQPEETPPYLEIVLPQSSARCDYLLLLSPVLRDAIEADAIAQGLLPVDWLAQAICTNLSFNQAENSPAFRGAVVSSQPQEVDDGHSGAPEHA